MQKTRIIPQRAPWLDSIELYIIRDEHNGQHSVPKPIEWETVGELELASKYPTPSFNLSHTDAQALMDELWNCGLRPTEGTGSAGALAATQKHLEDERQMVKRLLDKVLG